MKKLFFEYYRPSEEQFSELWHECLFVLDANVLLNLYRYSSETTFELIRLLKEISTRIWIPHQVAFEYHKNRHKVILEHEKEYTKVQDELAKAKDDAIKKLSDKLRQDRHPFIKEADKSITGIENAFNSIHEDLEKHKKEYASLKENDRINDEIVSLFQGQVWLSWNHEECSASFRFSSAPF